jgi:dTDP-4-dehydrorhamnose 3,5-epimerase
MIEQAVKDRPSANAAWELAPPTISGVQVKDVRNMLTANSAIAEAYRQDWGLHDRQIRHIITVSVWPGAVLAWHLHRIQTDHLFAVSGTFQAALYDDREDSPTYRVLNVLRLSNLRPGVLVIPPGVWHGFKNLTGQEAHFINYFDHAYRYDDPDEYKLPPDTDLIPFSFG